MLNFVICDDNLNILDKFSSILENIFMKHNYDAEIGLKTSNIDELLDYIDENKTDVLILDINLKPTIDEETGRYFLGIIFKEADKSFTNNCYYGFWNTVYFSSSIVENVKELFSGNVGVDQLTGPVGISEVVVKTQNVSQFVYILALISLSLGVTNLLPFPPLDGGKILLLIIEGIIRRPIKENVNSIEEFNYLYDAVGWGSYDEKVSEKALANTMYSVSVYDDDKIIGYGRIIGDGICFLYIHDVMVIPKYQNKKIGSQIMNKLLEKVNQIKIENPYVRVYLGASKGKEKFYERFGFITREDANLGSGMILDGFND